MTFARVPYRACSLRRPHVTRANSFLNSSESASSAMPLFVAGLSNSLKYSAFCPSLSYAGDRRQHSNAASEPLAIAGASLLAGEATQRS